MNLFEFENTNPALNLAIEKALFDTLDTPLFCLWRNPPSVILGRNQDLESEVDLNAAKKAGVRIVRRFSGGGAVYHDWGNLNFSFILSKRDFDVRECIKIISNALSEFNIDVRISGRNDLTLEDKKISGVAMYQKKNRVLLHGTLLFDTDLLKMQRVLTPNKSKLKRHSVSSVASRVGNLRPHLGIDFETFYMTFKSALDSTLNFKEVSIQKNFLKYVNSNYKIFSDDTWTNERKTYGKHSLTLNDSVRFSYSLEEDTIKNPTFSGDFFSTKNILELEEKLNGKKISEIYNQNIEFSDYISNLKTSEFYAVLESLREDGRRLN